MYLNADVPQFDCWIRSEYLHDLKSGHGKFEKAVVFGLASVPGQAVTFHCITESGAQVARMPISAFVHRKDAPEMPLDMLELWDCYSYEVGVHAFAWVKGMRCKVFLKDRRIEEGEYQFTVDWAGSAAAESAGPIGHKNAHILKLDNGCYAAQPNNRILWVEPSSIKTAAKRPRYLTNSHVWRAENGTAWQAPSPERRRRSKIAVISEAGILRAGPARGNASASRGSGSG